MNCVSIVGTEYAKRALPSSLRGKLERRQFIRPKTIVPTIIEGKRGVEK